MTEFADTGVFSLIVWSIGADALLGYVPKVEVKGTDVGWERSLLDCAFQAAILFMVTLLTVILVSSRRWALEIHPQVSPHGDRSELV